jgi:osmotically-inducible protein OsmY
MKNVSQDLLVPDPVDEVVRRPAAAQTTEAQRLAADIERAIKSRTGRWIRDLKVVVGREGVMLGGRCTTFYAKQLAQQAAMKLINDEPLTNSIVVG